MAEYVYVIKGLTKVVQPNKEILSGIWLSFLPGAKIGVIGPNGAGKSTLLRIMAGVEREFEGEAWPADGVRVGFLPQEPRLDLSKDVRGTLVRAFADVKALAPDEAEAASRIEGFVHAWAEAPIPEFRTELKTLAQWLPELLAFHRCNRVTNGRLEGANNKLGVLKRIAYGFVNPDNFAARALLWCPPMAS
jgi:ATPase subunit of ABC transporter with duplicated ATPase domains